MAFLKSPIKRVLILMALCLAIVIGFVSCGDQSPAPGNPPGDTIPGPKPGEPVRRDSLRIKKWATVYITSKEGFDSREVQDKIDSVKNFYRGLLRPFNKDNRNPAVLGFRNQPPIIKDNGETVFVFEVYANYEAPCDPCTVPTTRPPYPRFGRTDNDIDD